MTGPIVAYVGPFPFPADRADALRVLGMTDALAASGVQVLVGSGGDDPVSRVHLAGRREVTSYPLGEFPGPEFGRLRRVWRGLTWGGRTLKWVKGQPVKLDALMVYGTHLGYLARMIPWAKRNGIPIYLDVVEWYDPSHLPGGRFGPFAIANSISMRFVAPRADGVFCISSHLAEHFQRRGSRTMTVPPLFLPIKSVQVSPQEDAVSVCFAGSVGRKDSNTLRNAVKLMAEDSFKRTMTMHLVGPSRAEVEILVNAPIPSNVVCHGRVSRSTAVSIVAGCDFTLLQRPQKRYANAGFPSKVVESLIVGTPVIANLTSDLGQYLDECLNAIVLSDASIEAMRSGLLRSLQLSYFDRKAIAADAAKKFGPGTVSHSVRTFLRV